MNEKEHLDVLFSYSLVPTEEGLFKINTGPESDNIQFRKWENYNLGPGDEAPGIGDS